jgi:Tfp pilus assembly protein PilO
VTRSLRRPAAAGGVLALVLVLVWWQLLWQPQSSSLASARLQAQQQTTNLYQAEQTLGHLKHLQAIGGPMAAMEQQVSAAVPSTDAIDGFLLSLNATAQASGVTVDGVSPGVPVAAGALSTIPVSMSLTGPYADMEGFLESLRGGARLLVIDSLTESPGANAASSQTVSATVVAHLFTGLPSSAAAHS